MPESRVSTWPDAVTLQGADIMALERGDDYFKWTADQMGSFVKENWNDQEPIYTLPGHGLVVGDVDKCIAADPTVGTFVPVSTYITNNNKYPNMVFVLLQVIDVNTIQIGLSGNRSFSAHWPTGLDTDTCVFVDPTTDYVSDVADPNWPYVMGNHFAFGIYSYSTPAGAAVLCGGDQLKLSRKFEGNTTIDTTEELFRFPVAENESLIMEAKLTGLDEDDPAALGYHVSEKRIRAYRSKGGALTIIGAVQTDFSNTTGTLNNSALLLTIDGNDLVVSVDTNNATPAKWVGNVEITGR